MGITRSLLNTVMGTNTEVKEDKLPAVKIFTDASTQTDLAFFAAPDEKSQAKERVRNQRVESLNRQLDTGNEFFSDISKCIDFFIHINAQCKDDILLPDIVDHMGWANAKFSALKSLYDIMSGGKKDLEKTFIDSINLCDKYKTTESVKIFKSDKAYRDNETNKLIGYRDKIKVLLQNVYEIKRDLIMSDQVIPASQPQHSCCVIS